MHSPKFAPALLSTILLCLLGCSQSPVKTERRPDSLGISELSAVPTMLDDEEDSPTQYRKLRDQGMESYTRGDYSRAARLFEAAFLLYPETVDVWPRYLLYYCYLATGDYSHARTVAEELVKLAPYSARAYQQVGMAQLWAGKPKEAIPNFQRALEFSSHLPRVNYYLGLAYAQINKPELRTKAFKAAESEYLQTLTSNPKDFSANYELASLYLYWDNHIEKVPELIASAKEGLRASAESDTPERRQFQYFYLPLVEGIWLQRKGSWSTSTLALFTALLNLPSGARADAAEVLFFLGKNKLGAGDKTAAKNYFEKSLSSDPSGPYAGESQKLIRSLASREST